MSFRVRSEQGPCLIESCMMTKTREAVCKKTIFPVSKKRSIGCKKGKVEVLGEVDKQTIYFIATSVVIASEGDVDVMFSECITKQVSSSQNSAPAERREGSRSKKSSHSSRGVWKET